MKNHNCRMTPAQRDQHDRAVKFRKMTDAQLCEYLNKISVGNIEAVRSKISLLETQKSVLGKDNIRLSGDNLMQRETIAKQATKIDDLKKENQQNAAYAEIYQDICDKYGKNFRALLDKAKSLQTENVTVKKALELAAKHIYWLISNFDYTCHMKGSSEHLSCKISCVDCLQQQFAEQAKQLTNATQGSEEVTHGKTLKKERNIKISNRRDDK